jgi:hypothetical protein
MITTTKEFESRLEKMNTNERLEMLGEMARENHGEPFAKAMEQLEHLPKDKFKEAFGFHIDWKSPLHYHCEDEAGYHVNLAYSGEKIFGLLQNREESNFIEIDCKKAGGEIYCLDNDEIKKKIENLMNESEGRKEECMKLCEEAREIRKHLQSSSAVGSIMCLDDCIAEAGGLAEEIHNMKKNHCKALVEGFLQQTQKQNEKKSYRS